MTEPSALSRRASPVPDRSLALILAIGKRLVQVDAAPLPGAVFEEFR